MIDYRAYYRELRIDWLKLRGYLFDTNTGLPALPAVLDGVRRRLEDGEEMGLIYVDPSGGAISHPATRGCRTRKAGGEVRLVAKDENPGNCKVLPVCGPSREVVNTFFYAWSINQQPKSKCGHAL